MGLRSGSIGTAATTGLLFCAASVAGDFSSGQLRSNIFNEDPAPMNPYASKLSVQKY
jgi:hypothetical protein